MDCSWRFSAAYLAVIVPLYLVSFLALINKFKLEKKKRRKKWLDRGIFTQLSKYFSYYKILQYDSIILYHYVLLHEVSKLIRYDQEVKIII